VSIEEIKNRFIEMLVSGSLSAIKKQKRRTLFVHRFIAFCTPAGSPTYTENQQVTKFCGPSIKWVRTIPIFNLNSDDKTASLSRLAAIFTLLVS
jgi:hypothetical protein